MMCCWDHYYRFQASQGTHRSLAVTLFAFLPPACRVLAVRLETSICDNDDDDDESDLGLLSCTHA